MQYQSRNIQDETGNAGRGKQSRRSDRGDQVLLCYSHIHIEKDERMVGKECMRSEGMKVVIEYLHVLWYVMAGCASMVCCCAAMAASYCIC